jgi:hypothetical protein
LNYLSSYFVLATEAIWDSNFSMVTTSLNNLSGGTSLMTTPPKVDGDHTRPTSLSDEDRQFNDGYHNGPTVLSDEDQQFNDGGHNAPDDWAALCEALGRIRPILRSAAP